MRQANKATRNLWLLFAFAFCLNCIVWIVTRDKQVQWINVPPVPPLSIAALPALGDFQLAYRTLGVTIQNLGDEGGQVTPLVDYDFNRLGQWFHVMDRLDPQSDYIPYLASFYFGAVRGGEAKKKLRPVAEYLYKAGQSSEGQKWRWLAHAVYLARFKLDDLDWAYKMSLELSDLARNERPDLPHWARQMPAFILNEQGEKEAALNMMIGILSVAGEDIHPSEVNHTRYYICEKILTADQAKAFPLCQTFKE